MNVDKKNIENCLKIIDSALEKDAKRQDIYKLRFQENKTFIEISERVGTSKQNIDIIVSKFLEKLTLALRNKCLYVLMQDFDNLQNMHKNIVLQIIKRKTKKISLDKDVAKKIKAHIWALKKDSIENVLKKFMPKEDELTALALLIKDGFKVKNGEIVGFQGSIPIRDKIIAALEINEEMTVDEIIDFLKERGTENINEKYIRVTLAWKGFKNIICNTGKSTYMLCDKIAKQYDTEKIAETVKKRMLKEGLCDIDVRIVLEKYRDIFENAHIDNPYMAKAVLVLSGKFKRGKKFAVRLKTEECEQEEGNKILAKEIVSDILEKANKPMNLKEISEEAKKRFNRHIKQSSIPAILASLGKEIAKVEGGYILKEKLKNKNVPSFFILNKILRSIFQMFPKGFFINLFVKELEKIGEKTDKYILAEELKKRGYPIFGRKELMVVTPQGTKTDPLKKYILDAVQSGKHGSIKKLARKIAEEFGEAVDVNKVETKIRNISSVKKEK